VPSYAMPNRDEASKYVWAEKLSNRD
jgi:hypothetical protein